jgi:hypothetical protein
MGISARGAGGNPSQPPATESGLRPEGTRRAPWPMRRGCKTCGVQPPAENRQSIPETLGTPMNEYDSRHTAGTEPVERSQPLPDSPRGEDPGDRSASWDGYSPDTLAALDGLAPDVW